MRHKVSGKKLGRDSDHRKALFKNLARSFFVNQGQLNTTQAKAKAVRSLIEKMISRAKKGDLASRRWLFRFFQDHQFVNQLVGVFGKPFAERAGGYTRIVKLRKRRGDGAVVVRLESVENIKADEQKPVKKKPKDQKEVKKGTKSKK